jgi:predicted PurR-regulated permease PerM
MLQSINKLPRWLTLGLAFPLIFLNGWLLLVLVHELQPLVSILITATVIAFLLDYPIRFLHQRGLPRIIAVALVLLLFLLTLGILAFVLGPLILRQANELLTRLPEWIKSGQQQLKTLEIWATDQQLPIDVSTTFNQLIERLTLGLRSFTTQVIGLTFSAIGSVVNIFLTLVFSIFLVFRGDRLWSGILSWLPSQLGNQIRQSLPQNFERYIAGQVTMAAIVGIAQTATMVILGIPLAELFGFGIGAASLIPFGGTTTILIVSLLLALQNFWLGVKVLIVAIIISWGLENILAPRIVGEFTGLNPVWMLISLDIGIKVGGVLGLVIAVPIASFIKGTFETLRTSRGGSLSLLPATGLFPDEEQVEKPADMTPTK